MPAQSRSASVLFCTQVMISVSSTLWLTLSQASLQAGELSPVTRHCRRPSAKRAVAESSICCTSSVQIKGSAGLAGLDHTVPLGGLKISAQLKCEGIVLFTRFVSASLGVLFILRKSSRSLVLGFRALGLDVWLLTCSNRARFQVREEQNKGNIQVLERGAYSHQEFNCQWDQGGQPDSPGVDVRASYPVLRWCANLLMLPTGCCL